jgi:hypothetical protein
MATIHQIPVPKQPELTRDQKLRIQTLFFDANFTRDQICLQTGHSYRQVCYAIQHRLTPQKSKAGRRVILNIPQRKKLIEWVTASAENRQTPWVAIPGILNWDCGEKAIRTAFKKEGYRRCIATKKCPLSEENRKKRLEMSSGMRSSGVMKHGHNLGGILDLESLAGLKRSNIKIVWHQDIKGRLDGCFGGL